MLFALARVTHFLLGYTRFCGAVLHRPTAIQYVHCLATTTTGKKNNGVERYLLLYVLECPHRAEITQRKRVLCQSMGKKVSDVGAEVAP